MRKQSKAITVHTAFGLAQVTQADAVRILGVHPKTAARWANGTQTPSRKHAALLAILSGQVVPMPGWQGFRFEIRRGPRPHRRPFAVLVAPDGSEWHVDELQRAQPVRPVMSR